jgi:hypothetical protein
MRLFHTVSPRTTVNKGKKRKGRGVVPQPQVLVRYFS